MEWLGLVSLKPQGRMLFLTKLDPKELVVGAYQAMLKTTVHLQGKPFANTVCS